MKKQLLSIAMIFSQPVLSFAQKGSSEYGGKLINEIAEKGSYAAGIGVQFIYKITKHSGIESGFYYKTNPRYYPVNNTSPYYSFTRYNQKVIHLPLLYRFESGFINFTAGFAVEYFINMKEIRKKVPPAYTSDFFTRLEAIAAISLSKSFYFSRSWVIEPELKFSAPVPRGGVSNGINLSLRKRIF
jgi:hypothetical protein